MAYLQLAHKVRDPDTGKPRDVVLHHFGREDSLDVEQIRRLINSLSRFLPEADRAALQASQELGTAVKIDQVLSFGGTWLLDQLWKRLKLDKTIEGLAEDRQFRVDIERLIFAMVANRALAPSSKLGLEQWVGGRVAVPDLDSVAVQQLYRAMDFLVAHGKAIQKNVFFSVSSLLNLEVDLLFFDTTSTYFETEEADEEGLRRFGHSKDHRPDLPQIVIGLAVTRNGIPVRCWVLPGNTNDASLVETVQHDLAGWKLSRVIWVMDRGMAGEQQKVILQRGGGHYILGERLRTSERAKEALQRGGRYRRVRDNLEVKEVIVENGSDKRRYVLVYNPAQAKRDKALRDKTLERLQAEIDTLDKHQSSKSSHNKAVCALKSHRSMGRFLKELKSGKLRINRAKVREEERLDGKYLLSTTDSSLTAEEVALGYKQLLDVERAFRTLKSTLELRPVYHRLDQRIEAHVLLCWLALLLVRVVEQETGVSWPSIRNEMESLSLVKVETKDGGFQVVSTLTANQRKFLKALKIKAPNRPYSLSLEC